MYSQRTFKELGYHKQAADWEHKYQMLSLTKYLSFEHVVLACSFFTDTRYFWLGCTEFPPCNYEVSRGLRLLYALELGYYLQAGPST